ncbi:MAG: DUF3604 domain-containing protein [Pseudomonadales bacterium]
MKLAAVKATFVSCLLVLSGCGRDEEVVEVNSENFAGTNEQQAFKMAIGDELLQLRPKPNEQRNAYYGDLHVHTAYSFDAYAFGTTATPYDAYRFAKGEQIQHPSGYGLKIREPLDFYAVTDHAAFLGAVKEAANTDTELSKHELAKQVHNINAEDNLDFTSLGQRAQVFSTFLPNVLTALTDGSLEEDLLNSVAKSAWQDIADAAEMYNEPGRFTTFLAYEYTSATVERGNLHRNVIFRDNQAAPAIPFSRYHSRNPEDLWSWMDGLRAKGVESLAIPHNSNGSNGAMFQRTDWAGNAFTEEYSRTRMRNEPLVEITQIKGTSDTNPRHSPNDEWADFEIMPFRVGTTLPSKEEGSYVREAYLNGLSLEADGAGNPYKFGLVAASDTHVAATSDDEKSYFSKAGLLDGDAVARGSVPAPKAIALAVGALLPDSLQEIDGETYMATSSFETWGASGIAAVWAEENTRDSIYAAFRRKETFATTGPRIKLRFFAGYDFSDEVLTDEHRVETAYQQGVTMGATLKAEALQQPSFLVWAIADANTVPLQRVQIIKGSLVDGKTIERVYDVACSEGAKVDPVTQRCPDNGATVDISDCSPSEGPGAQELLSLWKDPDFTAGEEAFYYLRALENPTCRWSTWDAVEAGVEPRSDLALTIQERAWSSPIWYSKHVE